MNVGRLMEYAGTTYPRESRTAPKIRSVTPVQLRAFATLTGVSIALDIAGGAAFEVVDAFRAARTKFTAASGP